MKLKVTAIFTFMVLFLAQTGYSQKLNSPDFYAALIKADISKLWYNDINQPENDTSAPALPEPLGFTGDKYQRFYIPFISITKSKTNPYQYIVYGKTKVTENVCRFSGSINIVKARLFKSQVDVTYKQGFVEGDILFCEDSLQKGTGFLKERSFQNFTSMKPTMFSITTWR